MKELTKFTRVVVNNELSFLGVIKNDKRFIEGHRVLTSPVLTEYEEEGKKMCKTSTGSVYLLGEEMSNVDFYKSEEYKLPGMGNQIMKDIMKL